MSTATEEAALDSIDLMLLLVHGSKGERDPVSVIEDRLLDWRLAVVAR